MRARRPRPRRVGEAADIAVASNRSEPFPTHAAAIGQGGFAALGGITVQEAVLPLAADFGRLILAFHK